MKSLRTLAQLDLNLLTAFEALFRSKSVTKAAEHMGISQPAMSHTLARLRQAFDDPLFVKSHPSMSPTPLALALAPTIHEILQRIEGAILQRSDFDPRSLRKRFHIKTTDLIEALLAPTLARRLESDAPNVRFAITAPEFRFPKEDLEDGKADLAIGGFFGRLPSGFMQQRLVNDDFQAAVRLRHPRLGQRQRVSLSAFCAERHLLIAPSGDLHSPLDKVLERQGTTRFLAAGCSSYLVSGWVVSETDAVLTAPSRLIRLLAKQFSLNTFSPPVDLKPISVIQVWHAQHQKDPAHIWFRRLVHEVLSTD
jgi:DNA-binding transcriptional LysR family regulator